MTLWWALLISQIMEWSIFITHLSLVYTLLIEDWAAFTPRIHISMMFSHLPFLKKSLWCQKHFFIVFTKYYLKMPRPTKSSRPGFKPGNIPHNRMRKTVSEHYCDSKMRKTIRLTKELQKKVDSVNSKGVIAGQVSVGTSDRVLRPKGGPLSKTEEYASKSGDKR